MKLKNIKIKIKRDYIFLTIFLFIIALVGFVFIKYFVVKKIDSDLINSDIKPAYLRQSVPKIDNLKIIFDNPKFKEMIYQAEFFSPVVVDKQGRPNPFMPFMEKEEMIEHENNEEIKPESPQE